MSCVPQTMRAFTQITDVNQNLYNPANSDQLAQVCVNGKFMYEIFHYNTRFFIQMNNSPDIRQLHLTTPIHTTQVISDTVSQKYEIKDLQEFTNQSEKLTVEALCETTWRELFQQERVIQFNLVTIEEQPNSA